MNDQTVSQSAVFTETLSPAGSVRRDVSGSHAVAIWLLVCCALLFAMVVVGGVTRLTHSGLSIVEWQPLVGSIPPLNDAEWQASFQKYQQTPEFKLRNFDMDVEGFKSIFWWEYFHRLLGRMIGVVFFVPFAYFLWRGRARGTLAWKLAGIFLLGALQGGMGWYMVKSGLVDEPRVSHLRLTAHLGLAFLIFATQFWVALDILSPRRQRRPAPRSLARFAQVLAGVVFLMVLSGGLVAGLRAGLAYNTFPLMHGYLVPPDMFMLEPWYANFLGSVGAVQFDHRLIAWVLVIAIPLLWWRILRADVSASARIASHLFLGMLAIQFTLGVATLLLAVPVALGAAHQGGALILFALSLAVAHELS
jgi:cytochrome c oxidase assembly protein subunit 15